MRNVFLDLDNTLLSAEPMDEFPFDDENVCTKAIKFNMHNMDGYYIIFERPNVQNFLDWLFKNFNVSVWTAASKSYALFVIDNIILTKKNRKLDYILTSYHCNISKKHYNYSKCLQTVFDKFKLSGYDANNTIIIDDLQEVYECQPKNAINIKRFEILENNSDYDLELVSIHEKINHLFKQM